MNDYFNPQEAADQTHPTYRKLTAQLGLVGLDTTIPGGVRALAEKTVGKTREVYDRSIGDFEASVATFERTFDAAGQAAAAFNRKVIDIAQRNLDSSFDLATSLAGAKDLADMAALQAAYWREQIDALTEQAEEVRALSMKVMADSVEPIRPNMAHGPDERTPLPRP
jgi:phasin